MRRLCFRVTIGDPNRLSGHNWPTQSLTQYDNIPNVRDRWNNQTMKPEVWAQQKPVHVVGLFQPEIDDVTRDHLIDPGHRLTYDNSHRIPSLSPLSTSRGVDANRITNRLNVHWLFTLTPILSVNMIVNTFISLKPFYFMILSFLWLLFSVSRLEPKPANVIAIVYATHTNRDLTVFDVICSYLMMNNLTCHISPILSVSVSKCWSCLCLKGNKRMCSNEGRASTRTRISKGVSRCAIESAEWGTW